jgi:hypothetical protein
LNKDKPKNKTEMETAAILSGNPVYLPRKSSNLGLVESAFLNSDGLPHFSSVVAIGAASRASGPIYDRPFNGGVVWSSFSGDATEFVNNADFPTSCALEENWITDSAVMFGPKNMAQNAMSLFRDETQQGVGGSQEGPCSGFRSYGSYSNAPNFPLSGAAAYACSCNLTNPNQVWANQ